MNTHEVVFLPSYISSPPVKATVSPEVTGWEKGGWKGWGTKEEVCARLGQDHLGVGEGQRVQMGQKRRPSGRVISPGLVIQAERGPSFSSTAWCL